MRTWSSDHITRQTEPREHCQHLGDKVWYGHENGYFGTDMACKKLHMKCFATFYVIFTPELKGTIHLFFGYYLIKRVENEVQERAFNL